MTGRTIICDAVSDDTTVFQIKEIVESKENIPWWQQRLVYAGKMLNDRTKLGSLDINIKPEPVFHLMLRLRAGELHHTAYESSCFTRV